MRHRLVQVTYETLPLPQLYIDFEDQDIMSAARMLAANAHSEHGVVRNCFEFVRDEIRHSSDFKLNPVTCKASDALRHKTGILLCQEPSARSLTPANGIPTGLCYQRLSVGDSGAPYCLHGLNAVHLQDFGWYRIDAWQQDWCKRSVLPPLETLALPIKDPRERDLPEIWSEPLPSVIEVLERYETYDQVLANLPDIELTGRGDR